MILYIINLCILKPIIPNYLLYYYKGTSLCDNNWFINVDKIIFENIIGELLFILFFKPSHKTYNVSHLILNHRIDFIADIWQKKLLFSPYQFKCYDLNLHYNSYDFN